MLCSQMSVAKIINTPTCLLFILAGMDKFDSIFKVYSMCVDMHDHNCIVLYLFACWQTVSDCCCDEAFAEARWGDCIVWGQSSDELWQAKQCSCDACQRLSGLHCCALCCTICIEISLSRHINTKVWLSSHLKLKPNKARNKNSSLNYGTSPAIWGGRLSWPRLPGNAPAGSRTRDLSVMSPTP